jgi:hypothetical protein
MWRPAWKKPGNAVHCVIFQKADALRRDIREVVFNALLRRKPKAWRGTKLYAIASGFGGLGRTDY